MLQCVQVCCSVLQCVKKRCSVVQECLLRDRDSVLQCVAVCCSVLQCVAGVSSIQNRLPRRASSTIIEKNPQKFNPTILHHSAELAPTQCVALGCRQVTQTHESFFLLQLSATHCNTLQHTATHCNTLQHTATLCNTLQHSATYRNTLQHTTTQHGCISCVYSHAL